MAAVAPGPSALTTSTTPAAWGGVVSAAPAKREDKVEVKSSSKPTFDEKAYMGAFERVLFARDSFDVDNGAELLLKDDEVHQSTKDAASLVKKYHAEFERKQLLAAELKSEYVKQTLAEAVCQYRIGTIEGMPQNLSAYRRYLAGKSPVYTEETLLAAIGRTEKVAQQLKVHEERKRVYELHRKKLAETREAAKAANPEMTIGAEDAARYEVALKVYFSGAEMSQKDLAFIGETKHTYTEQNDLFRTMLRRKANEMRLAAATQKTNAVSVNAAVKAQTATAAAAAPSPSALPTAAAAK